MTPANESCFMKEFELSGCQDFFELIKMPKNFAEQKLSEEEKQHVLEHQYLWD